jgi:phosphoethanolamine N-methyltransferase
MPSDAVTQESLDSTQYAVESIRQYEAVFGNDFVSPGGQDMALELIEQMELKPKSRVLDVGCGLGGNAFTMAREFDLLVDGIDLSKNMLVMAEQKLTAYGLADRVSVEQGDCLQLDRPEYYDAIYSRDVFLHIPDKSRLFSVFHALLKPGGKLLFTDYCCGEKPWTDEFSDYVDDRGYSLHHLSEYAELIIDAGFTRVESRDITARFIEILQADLTKIDNLKLSESVRDKLKQSWLGKLERAGSGDHRWGLFSGLKRD